MHSAQRIRILMLLENESYPEDCRVLLEAESLVEAGYHVTIISPTSKTSRRKLDQVGRVRVYRYPCPMQFSGVTGYALEYGYSILAQFGLACWVLLREGFDVIHLHAPPDMNAVIPIFFKLIGKRFVYDLHDLSPELFQAQRDGRGNRWIEGILLKFERLAACTAHRLIATNETQRQVQIQRCGADPERCYIVRNGPHESFLQASIPLEGLQAPGKLTIGYVGVIGVQDGVDYLIRALDELRAKHHRNDFQAIIVGDGPALRNIRRMVDRLGLSAMVRFSGMVPFASVPEYIASFDICATPDPSNAYNDSCTTIKTMEYMALRKPVVCFRTNENENTAGDAALYAEDNDIAEYAAKLKQLMDDAEMRKRMGCIGRQRIEDGLTWSHQSRNLVAVYDDLFGTRRARQSPISLATGVNNHEGSTNPPVIAPLRRYSAQARHRTYSLEVRFGFDRTLNKVLHAHFMRDVAQARLNARFRLYYRVRPYIPLSLRQFLQRTRNQQMHVPDQWYIPSDFLVAWRKALESLLLENPTSQLIHPWPAPKQFAISLTHDVETQDGVRSVAELASLEESLGLRSAWNFVPFKYQVDAGLLDDLKQRGHEVGVHGYNHDGRLFTSKSIFNHRVPFINEAVERFGASGFRAPMVHRNLEWLQQIDVDYDASCFDIDPFQAMPGGIGGVWPFLVGRMVELPYSLPQDHTLLVALGETTPRIWLDKLRLLHHLSGMAMLISHPDYLDTHQRRGVYVQLLEHVREQTEAWLALPREIALWWRARDASTACPAGTISGPVAERGRMVSYQELFADFLATPDPVQ